MTPATRLDPASLQCEWLWVYEALVPLVETWSKEIVVPPGIFFVLTGQARIRADGREFDLPPGQVFFSAPGLRRQWFAKGTRLLSVGFRAGWQDGPPLFSTGLNCAHPTRYLEALHTATRRLFRDQHGTRRTVTYREAISFPPGSLLDWCRREAAFRAWFAEYVEALARRDIHATSARNVGDERIREVIRRLEAWPLAEPLAVERLVDGLHLGKRRLEQLLITETGLTPHAHFNRRRIEVSRQLLTGTVSPLKQIAHELGFVHASHFTKWFRHHAGMAPSAYREGAAAEAA